MCSWVSLVTAAVSPTSLIEFKTLSRLNSCLNRIVSFTNINSVSSKTRDKNLNAAISAF